MSNLTLERVQPFVVDESLSHDERVARAKGKIEELSEQIMALAKLCKFEGHRQYRLWAEEFLQCDDYYSLPVYLPKATLPEWLSTLDVDALGRLVNRMIDIAETGNAPTAKEIVW